jgi:hypothetical protein
MAAQHQHYVPKLLLKGFLSRDPGEAANERVRVLDLIENKDFVTSIDNIMGERRFNDFWLDEEYLATVEPAASRIESHVAPMVERIRKEKRLLRTPEELSDLCLLMAFQLIRTKKMRQLPERLNQQIIAHVERMGLDPRKVQRLEAWDEEKLKREHVRHQVRNLGEYAKHFADKEFFLMVAPEGSTFYLGDHPVVLHSDEERHFMRGLGIGVPYIQIYLPLSSELMLCAYCPAVLGQLMKGRDEEMAKGQGMVLKALMDGKITPAQMKEFVEGAKEHDLVSPLIDAIRAGEPVNVGPEQVQCYNSLQAFQAHRFVVDPDGTFEVAREMIAEREAADAEDDNRTA